MLLDVAEAVRRLDLEADRLRGQAAHYHDQRDLEQAFKYAQLEYGMRLLAHVFSALDEDER